MCGLSIWPINVVYAFLVTIVQLCIFSLSFFLPFQIDRSGRIPRLRFRDRESYAGNKTKEYDDLAMKYLSYVLFFLVACSSVYSLMYEQHKSWYSWILSSLTSCVYMFGKLLQLLLACSFTLLLISYLLYNQNPDSCLLGMSHPHSEPPLSLAPKEGVRARKH